MSHSKERKEKNCLNCGTTVEGRYCHVCGQENIEPEETVWGLVTHFFYDITHFDGKFFSTVKFLLFKPGFLSREYIIGRRARYLHPIRMYVFTSAFFFIIFFSLFKPSEMLKFGNENEEQLKKFTEASITLKEAISNTKDSVVKAAQIRALAKIDKSLESLQSEIDKKKIKDSLLSINAKKHARIIMDSLGKEAPSLKNIAAKIDTSKSAITGIDTGTVIDTTSGNGNIKVSNIKYHSQLAYDSVQNELPDSLRDNWFEKMMSHRAITLNSKWNNDKKEAIALFVEKFMHMLPQAMFLSLPAFAFLLLILYARRKFYYVDHGIFSIHLYCATFILLLIYFGLDKLRTLTHFELIRVVETLTIIGIFFYLYKAMRRFYQQRRFKTIIKFLILNFMSMIVVTVLIVLFFVLSLYQFS